MFQCNSTNYHITKKAIRITSFQSQNSHQSLFSEKKNYILKISEKAMIDNVLFFIKTTNNIPPSVLKNLFKLCYNFHHYSTSGLIIFENFQYHKYHWFMDLWNLSSSIFFTLQTIARNKIYFAIPPTLTLICWRCFLIV